MAAKTEVAPKATFNTDDKRAQYARLVAFNHAVAEKMVKKGTEDVNSVSESILTKAVDSLTGGNMLDGKEGIDLIIKLTKAGAEDPKVAERGLTTAYAQEVRPFLRRKTLSAKFGRRAGERKPREKKAEKKAENKKEPKGKKSTPKKAAKKEAPPEPTPEPEAEEAQA